MTRNQMNEFTIRLAGEEPHRVGVDSARSRLTEVMNGLGAGVVAPIARPVKRMRAFHAELVALIIEVSRADCEKLLNLWVAEFTTPFIGDSTANKREFSSYGDVAIAKARTHTDIDIVLSESVRFQQGWRFTHYRQGGG